jgi:hypothetical protein
MSSTIELDSSFVRSTPGESTTTTQSHGKKWKSPVWQYCRRPTADENQDHLYCTCCPQDPLLEGYKELYNTKILENIKKHLLIHHQIIIEKVLNKN